MGRGRRLSGSKGYGAGGREGGYLAPLGSDRHGVHRGGSCRQTHRGGHTLSVIREGGSVSPNRFVVRGSRRHLLRGGIQGVHRLVHAPRTPVRRHPIVKVVHVDEIGVVVIFLHFGVSLGEFQPNCHGNVRVKPHALKFTSRHFSYSATNQKVLICDLQGLFGLFSTDFGVEHDKRNGLKHFISYTTPH